MRSPRSKRSIRSVPGLDLRSSLACIPGSGGRLIRIGRQHIRDGVLTVRQQKTGDLAIPVRADLAAYRRHSEGQSDVADDRTGKSYSAERLHRPVSRAGAMPPDCRRIASFTGCARRRRTRLAEAGCTAHEIAAISGHAA